MALSVVAVAQDSDIAQSDVDDLTGGVPADDRCDTNGVMWDLDTWRRYASDPDTQGLRCFLIRDEQNRTHAGILLQRRSAIEVRIRGMMIPQGPRLDDAITRLLTALAARGFTLVWGNVFNNRLRARYGQIAGVQLVGRARVEWRAP